MANEQGGRAKFEEVFANDIATAVGGSSDKVCVLVCVHFLVCTSACLCVFPRVYVCMCACVHVCMCASVLVCVCACVHVCICACAHVCMCACVNVRMCACEHVSYVCVRVCTSVNVGAMPRVYKWSCYTSAK